MTHLPRLGALALVVALSTAACSEGNRRPVSDPGSARPSVGQRDGNSAKPSKNRDRRDETRCNAGNGNGNGNGRCRSGNGNRGRGNP